MPFLFVATHARRATTRPARRPLGAQPYRTPSRSHTHQRRPQIFDADCLKLGVSKGLSYAIILGSCAVKLPQIRAIHSAGSADGVSLDLGLSVRSFNADSVSLPTDLRLRVKKSPHNTRVNTRVLSGSPHDPALP